MMGDLKDDGGTPSEPAPGAPEPQMRIGTTGGEPLLLPLGLLKKHAVCLGASGSGKTVLAKTLIEEVVRNGVPALLIDPQGDLASLALMAHPLEIRAHNGFEEEYREFADRVEVRIFTPASSKGLPLSINPLKLPPSDVPKEEAIRSMDLTAASVVELLDYDTSADDGKAARSALYRVLEEGLATGRPPEDFVAVAKRVEALGDDVLTEKGRMKLSRNLRYLTEAMNSLLFNYGNPLSMELFTTPIRPGRVPLNIVYLNSLVSDHHKQFFVAMLESELYSWMLQHPSERLQFLFYIDEVAPYMPPHPRNPPAKDALKLLFKQGRKYGVGCIMVTQNPADIDYKAMAQASTWALGRMMAKQDLEKMKPVLKALNAANLEDVLVRLPTVKPPDFLLLCPDVFTETKECAVRWLYTKHTTLDEDKLRGAMAPEVLEALCRAGPEMRRAEGGGRDETAKRAPEPQPSAPAPQTPREAPVEAVEAGPPEQAPKKPDYYAPYAASLIVCRLDFPKQQIAKEIGRLVGDTFGGWRLVEAKYLLYPVWRLRCTIPPAPANPLLRLMRKDAGGPVSENLYVSALNGKLLTLKGGRMLFTSVVEERAEGVQDLDSCTSFEILRKEALEARDGRDAFLDITFSPEAAATVIRRMFAITPEEVTLVLVPMWNIVAESRKGKQKTLVVDGNLGRVVEGIGGA